MKMNVNRDKPEHRLILAIILIIMAIVIAYLLIAVAKIETYRGVILAGPFLLFGIYIIITLPAYKKRYLAYSILTTPEASDCTELEGNSEELKKQIEDELSKKSSEESKTKSVFFGVLFVSLLVFSVLENSYDVSLVLMLFSLIQFIKNMRLISSGSVRVVNKLIIAAGIFGICFTPVLIMLLLHYEVLKFTLIAMPSILLFLSIFTVVVGLLELKDLKSKDKAIIDEPAGNAVADD